MVRRSSMTVPAVLAFIPVVAIPGGCASDDDSGARRSDAAPFDATTASGGSSGAAGSGGAPIGVDCDCALGAYRPACGVDGVTYDATCGIECVPVDIACMSECPCQPAPGEYMGVCAGDGGFECNGDLVCVQWFELNGGSGMGGRYCTQPCSEGCPEPSPGCGDNDRCERIGG